MARRTRRRAVPSNVPEVIKILRQVRLAKDIPQEELSRQVGVNINCVGDWENGKASPGLGLFLAWAQALGFSVALIPEKVSIREDKL